jgi:putative DNA primase/helicase
MSEVDLPDRLRRYGGPLIIRRAALNEDDVLGNDELPFFEADSKAKDPRYRWFKENFGDRCWELDALSPVVLRERVRVAMSLKSEFADSAGFDLFNEWSATADGYDVKAVRATWRSIKPDGGVTIGTLLQLAKEHGFELPKTGQAASAPDPEAVTRLARERAASQQAESVRQEAAHAHAAGEAVALWEQASETGESPYLTRKGVKPYGVRFTADGWLLVPLRDAAGVLWSVQRIAPVKPAEGGTDKLFWKGGLKAGLWHLLGNTSGTGGNGVGPAVLLICEGYATAASLHEATGYPVACAFDCGNLGRVARELRKLHPAALLVLCGDDDLATFARTGSNAGRDRATRVARSMRGLSVFPSPLREDQTDFNDLHQAAGLDAVRAIVQNAIEAHQASQTAAQAAQKDKPSKKSSPNARDASGGAAGDIENAYDPFTVSDSGVWHEGFDQQGNRKPPEWICSRLEVVALTRDQDGCAWGYLMNFVDPMNHAKQWAMPGRMLAGDGGELRVVLLSMGLRIATSPRARCLLTQYIQTREPKEFAICTDKIGWHGHAYVLPGETIGVGTERIVFQSDSPIENTFRCKGTLDQWRDRVGFQCVGNTRLAFAVMCALAGPLLKIVGMESGGFHYRGDSSSGKTTALKLAASVYGGPSYLQRWRSTDNALESTAAQHNDCGLILDELAQLDPKAAGDCALMLANEAGKIRATRTGSTRAKQTWRLLFLSAGELGLADHIAEGGKRIRPGQEVRMADIPSDAGVGLGAFEELHGHSDGASFAKYITRAVQAVYGTPGRAWLEWLTTQASTDADALKASIRREADAIAAQIIPKNSSGQVERVGARFALMGAAGELATAAGLTSWPAGESEAAARACFEAWLAARGGRGNGEEAAMLRQVRRFFEQHGEGRFSWWHRGADDHNAKTLTRAEVRRMLDADDKPIKTNNQHGQEFGNTMPVAMGEDVSVGYFDFTEVFRVEVCQGFDYQAVCRVLLKYGLLIPGTGRSYDCKQRLPGVGLVNCYHISAAILSLDI